MAVVQEELTKNVNLGLVQRKKNQNQKGKSSFGSYNEIRKIIFLF